MRTLCSSSPLEKDPSVPGVVVDEGDVILASSECYCLCRSTKIGVNYIRVAFAHISLFWKGVLMLFAELTSFTYSYNLRHFEGQEFNDNSFQLYSLELLEIDVATSFVP